METNMELQPDPYISFGRAARRLIFEYEEHKSLVVAFDFDDTIYDIHNSGSEYPYVIETLKLAKEIGCFLICWTGNPDTDMIKRYLAKNGISADLINENPPFVKGDPRKIYANVYLDDRAGLQQAVNDLRQVINYVFQRPE